MSDQTALSDPITLSQDDLAELARAGVPSPAPPPSKRSLRRKLLLAVLIAGAGLGASFMSCVGQSFSLRQARAQEGIEQQLRAIRAGCTVVPQVEPAR